MEVRFKLPRDLILFNMKQMQRYKLLLPLAIILRDGVVLQTHWIYYLLAPRRLPI